MLKVYWKGSGMYYQTVLYPKLGCWLFEDM